MDAMITEVKQMCEQQDWSNKVYQQVISIIITSMNATHEYGK